MEDSRVKVDKLVSLIVLVKVDNQQVDMVVNSLTKLIDINIIIKFIKTKFY